MTTLGIDGCKAGWCAAELTESEFSITIFSEFSGLIEKFESADIMLIDIPVGLGDQKTERDLDKAVRKLLHRSSSIFIPPVREALSAKSYQEAKAINKDVTGKMISVQSWNIAQKIKEVDHALLSNRDLKKKLFESHPELRFEMLNGGKALQFKKNALQSLGIQERLDILSNFHENVIESFECGCKQTKRLDVKKDDIVDAMCLAIVAMLGLKNGFQMIRGLNKTDSQGIEMIMYYYNPNKF